MVAVVACSCSLCGLRGAHHTPSTHAHFLSLTLTLTGFGVSARLGGRSIQTYLAGVSFALQRACHDCAALIAAQVMTVTLFFLCAPSACDECVM